MKMAVALVCALRGANQKVNDPPVISANNERPLLLAEAFGYPLCWVTAARHFLPSAGASLRVPDDKSIAVVPVSYHGAIRLHLEPGTVDVHPKGECVVRRQAHRPDNVLVTKRTELLAFG